MASPFSDLDRPPLRAAALREALLAPAGPLARLEVLEEVGSTNTELAARAAADPARWPHLSVLSADHQSAGRGRLGRTWTAPPRSGLAVSVLLRPAGVPRERWSWLPLLAGAALVGALRAVAGLPGDAVGLKWPNDVLVDGRKLAGILTEALPDAALPDAALPDAAPPGVVVGIGVNVSTTPAELAQLADPAVAAAPGTGAGDRPGATSLALLGAATDRDVLLRALLRALAHDVDGWASAAGDPAASGLGERVRAVCSTLGREVAVTLPGGARATGTALGLDDTGALLLRTGGRAVVALAAGDVVHLR